MDRRFHLAHTSDNYRTDNCWIGENSVESSILDGAPEQIVRTVTGDRICSFN